MSRTLLNIIGRCSHEFSWPRRWSDGLYYQVCVLCGDEWQYDWKRMERTERIPSERRAERAVEGMRKAPARQSHARQKPTWTPRARRLKLENRDMKFRERGSADWLQGTVENISKSGVAFRTELPLRENAAIEMILEMPKEITGQDQSIVLCSCTVVRTVSAEEENGAKSYGAVLWDYRFLHDRSAHKI